MLGSERDFKFSLYEVDVVVSTGPSGCDARAVPVAISAASVTVGMLLIKEDTRKIDAGTLRTSPPSRTRCRVVSKVSHLPGKRAGSYRP